MAGAEEILRLRSLRASHDFDAYWRFHEQRERASNHDVNYAGSAAPSVAPVTPSRGQPALRLVAGGA